MKHKTPTLLALAMLGAVLAFVPTAAHATRNLTLTVLTPTPQASGEITLLGSVGSAGTTATLEAYAGGKWVAVGSATTADDGTFLISRPADSAGTKYFRTSVSASGSEPAATSPYVQIWVSPEPADKFDTVPQPRINGDQTVGSTLQVDWGTWSPNSEYLISRWNRNGVFTGATGAKYSLTAADIGSYVTVTVRSRRASSWTVRDSRPTTRVTRGTFKTKPPEIVGRAVTGEQLTAQLDGWTPQPQAISYQWQRDGSAIDAATDKTHTIAAEDVGTTLTVVVKGTADGLDPATATSGGFVVPGKATRRQRTFGDVMQPLSSTPWNSTDLTYEARSSAPAWGTSKRVRWDTPGAFTHSLNPQPMGTLFSAQQNKPSASAAAGGEYPGTNPVVKNADVTFTVTARRFAIAFRGTAKYDAMVWIDSKPVAADPIFTPGTNDYLSPNWIVITLPARRTVQVRFAGPYFFTGVDYPADDPITVSATPPGFTLGILADSYYEFCSDVACMSRNAAPSLASLTGFRVWNMAEGSSGYLASSTYSVPGYEPSPFGSAKRLAGVVNAPIDALLISGSLNDARMDSAEHRAAVNKLLNELEAARPDLPVVLEGIEPIGLYPAQAKAMTATLASMVGRHQNVVGFIDPYTSPWLTGTGSIANPKGDGNRDRYLGKDNIHLSAAGMVYYQQRVADALRALPLPAGD